VALPASQRARRPMRQTVKSVVAPVGGLNTRDALDAMPPSDAVVLENWYPDTGKVIGRRGMQLFATLGGSIDTLAELNAGAVRQLVAAGNGKLYNAAAGTTLATGFGSNQWQAVNFRANLFLVNGVDAEQVYDGTTVSAAGWTGMAAPAVGIHIFAGRVWLWEPSSQTPYYAGLGNITGAVTAFPLNRVARFGGNLIAMGTLSRDSNEGPQNYCAFVMDTGEVIVYFGTDPATWALVGSYLISPPLSVRSVVGVAGDLALITQTDYAFLSDIMNKGLVQGDNTKMVGALVAAVQAGANLFGWQIIHYPAGKFLMANVPNSDGTYSQHVLNTVTNAWTIFKGWNARSWSLFNDRLYFGAADGNVYLADSGTTDAGAAITLDGRQAWNDFREPFRKRVMIWRPVLQITGNVSYAAGIGYDFVDATLPTPTAIQSGGTQWDVGQWDSFQWFGGAQVQLGWGVSGGTGQAISPRIYIQNESTVSWLRSDFRMESGINL